MYRTRCTGCVWFARCIGTLQAEDLEAAEVRGVKYYPRGVTTGSELCVGGEEDMSTYSFIFSKLADLNKTLHIHGEEPGACVLHAESLFIDKIDKIRKLYPNLKIVLEHVTTRDAVEYVKQHERPLLLFTTLTSRLTLL